ncbi:MAG: hypothetical protein ACOC0M_00620 [Halomonas sp.]
MIRRRIADELARQGFRLAGARMPRGEWIETPDREEEAAATALAYIGRQGSVVVEFDQEGEIEDWRGSSDNAEAAADLALAPIIAPA